MGNVDSGSSDSSISRNTLAQLYLTLFVGLLIAFPMVGEVVKGEEVGTGGEGDKKGIMVFTFLAIGWAIVFNGMILYALFVSIEDSTKNLRLFFL